MSAINLPTLSGVEHTYADPPGLRMHIGQGRRT
jgi:hypothetical protein